MTTLRTPVLSITTNFKLLPTSQDFADLGLTGILLLLDIKIVDLRHLRSLCEEGFARCKLAVQHAQLLNRIRRSSCRSFDRVIRMVVAPSSYA